MSQNNEPANHTADPLIDEIRAIRREISEQFGNDVFRLGRHLQDQEQHQREHEVKPPPQPSRQDEAG
jgi:hypothetical protein